MPFTVSNIAGGIAKALAASAADTGKVLEMALKREAQHLRAQIVTGITTQAPGGQAFEPLAYSTLKTRRRRGFAGTKALLVRADLRNSIHVETEGSGADTKALIGVFRSVKGSGGQELVDIARINEFGAVFAVPNGKGGATVIKIPARPFFGPVMAAEAPGIQTRFLQFMIDYYKDGLKDFLTGPSGQ